MIKKLKLLDKIFCKKKKIIIFIISIEIYLRSNFSIFRLVRLDKDLLINLAPFSPILIPLMHIIFNLEYILILYKVKNILTLHLSI